MKCAAENDVVMLHVSASRELIIRSAPGAPLASLIGELMKGLAEVLRTREPLVNITRLATLFGHRRDARQRCHVLSCIEATAIVRKPYSEPDGNI